MVRYILLLIVLVGVGCLAFAEPESSKVAITELGAIEPIKDGEHYLGTNNRMFLIEDQWEFDQCALLLPTLPKIDTQSECLLVIMSWKATPRTLKSVESEGDTLVINVDQQPPPKWWSDLYHPPQFLVFKLPNWPGPVRFEVNGDAQFTIPRGKELTKRCDELWEEVLRIHSGGGPTLAEMVEHYKRLSPDKSEKELRELVMKNKNTFRTLNRALLYPTLFGELVNIRARPAIPRIFALIESMGNFDSAFDPAFKAVVGIGGPDVVGQCKTALTSWNPRSRHAAILVLRDLRLPESRPIACEHLADLYEPVGRSAFDLLCRLGITKNDIPGLIQALEKIEAFYLTPEAERPKVDYGGDVGKSIILALGSLGADAKDALPVLTRMATDPRLPQPGFAPDAKKAIEKINGESPVSKD